MQVEFRGEIFAARIVVDTVRDHFDMPPLQRRQSPGFAQAESQSAACLAS